MWFWKCNFQSCFTDSGIFKSSYDNVLRWMLQNLTDDKSTLVLVMAWCRRATSHCLSQCWPRSLSPYGITRPEWVKWKKYWIIYHITLNPLWPSDYTIVWFLRAPRWYTGPTAMPRAAVTLLAVTAARGIAGGMIYQRGARTKSRYYHYYHLISWCIIVL